MELSRGLVLCLFATMLSKALSFTARPAMLNRLSRLNVATIRDADFVGKIVGGERYEMVPLPDSMISTTLFVGNLCEFVTDDILSRVFQAVSKLQSVPACVARKPNMSSMQYGFVHFLTVEEKEVRFAPHCYRTLGAYRSLLISHASRRLQFLNFTEPNCMDVPSRWKRFGTFPSRIASVCQEKWSLTLAG
jgi:hypothetical protein